tara:strand:- start:406166 stop:406582 length:417 start_codon:yes stop_codon:yes gene_type:complete
MKLIELQNRVRTESRFIKARKEARKDLAFQISHMIEELRVSLNCSQSKLAEIVGITQPAVARLEGGIVVASLPMLQRIAEATKHDLILPAFVNRGKTLLNNDITTRSIVATGTSSHNYHSVAQLERAGTRDLIYSLAS